MSVERMRKGGYREKKIFQAKKELSKEKKIEEVAGDETERLRCDQQGI